MAAERVGAVCVIALCSLAGCAHERTLVTRAAPRAPGVSAGPVVDVSEDSPAVTPADPVGAGVRPWWAEVTRGPYRLEGASLPGRPWLLAVGRSEDHHHIAEGLLDAKVSARLALRGLADPAQGVLPAPVLLDVFVTPRRELFVLYGQPLESAPGSGALELLTPPSSLVAAGPHHVGRHRFHDDRHLFLECDVEGPVANPSWGARRVFARLDEPE